jgi:hypothetical protein
MLRSIAIETRSAMPVDGLGVPIGVNLLTFILAVRDVEYTDVSVIPVNYALVAIREVIA